MVCSQRSDGSMTPRRAFDDIELTVLRAIRWATNLPEPYTTADDELRRQLNQAVLRRLLVWEDGVAACEYTDGVELLFQTITTVRPIPSQQTKERADTDREDPTASARVLSLVPSSRHGLNIQHVVEAMGIEPTTSCMPCKRSTN